MINSKYYILVIVSLLIIGTGCKTTKDSTNIAKKEKGDKEVLSEALVIKLTRAYIDGSKEKILGNLDLASNYYNECLKIDANHHASLYELANINMMQGKDAIALVFAKRSVELDGDNEWYSIQYAQLLDKMGSYSESIKVYKKLLEKKPKQLEYLHSLAYAYMFSERMTDAIDIFNRIEAVIGVQEEISMQKQRIYLSLEDNKNAIQEIKTLLDAYPEEPKYYRILAELHQMNDDPEKAKQIFEELIQIDPDNAYVHLSLSDFYSKQGKTAEAHKELKLAFQNKELTIDSKVRILLAYFSVTGIKEETKIEAFELAKIITETHPEEAKAHSLYGDFLYRDNRIKEAKEAYTKALELDDSKYIIWNQLILILSELKDFKTMFEVSGKAVELFPNQPSFYLFNGISAIQIKNYEASIKALNQGKTLVYDNPLLKSQFYANLGDSYNNLKNFAMSDSAYEQALVVDPNNQYVLNNFSYFLSLRGDKLEKAEKMAKHCVDLNTNSASYLDTYAWVLFVSGKYKEAEKWLKQALEKGGGSNAVILEHYGDVLFKTDNREEALNYWIKAKSAGTGSEYLEQKIETKTYVQ